MAVHSSLTHHLIKYTLKRLGEKAEVQLLKGLSTPKDVLMSLNNRIEDVELRKLGENFRSFFGQKEFYFLGKDLVDYFYKNRHLFDERYPFWTLISKITSRSELTEKDVKEELRRINHELCPLDIVLVNTRAGSRYGYDDYVSSGCGMGYEATMYLLEKGVRLTGTDAWSWDAPFVYTAKKYQETRDPSLIWEGHKAGRDIGYCHLEKLHNLELLPSSGFMVACFPVKIRKASAAWTRAVAIINE